MHFWPNFQLCCCVCHQIHINIYAREMCVCVPQQSINKSVYVMHLSCCIQSSSTGHLNCCTPSIWFAQKIVCIWISNWRWKLQAKWISIQFLRQLNLKLPSKRMNCIAFVEAFHSSLLLCKYSQFTIVLTESFSIQFPNFSNSTSCKYLVYFMLDWILFGFSDETLEYCWWFHCCFSACALFSHAIISMILSKSKCQRIWDHYCMYRYGLLYPYRTYVLNIYFVKSSVSVCERG